MKVLHVIPSLGAGGAEQSLAEMLPLLLDRGIETEVVCFTQRKEGVRGLVEQQGVRVTYLSETSGIRRVWALRRLLLNLRPNLVHSSVIEANLISRLAACANWHSCSL